MPLAFFVLTQYRRVTDRQTDRHVAIATIAIASRGQKGGDIGWIVVGVQLRAELWEDLACLAVDALTVTRSVVDPSVAVDSTSSSRTRLAVGTLT